MVTKRIQHVFKAFYHIAARCIFPAAEIVLLPVIARKIGAMQLSMLSAGGTKKIFAGFRWILYGSKVVTREEAKEDWISCVPFQSCAEEPTDLTRILKLPEETHSQLYFLALTFILEV